MPNITISDLFAKIGQLTVENDALRAENEMLRGSLAQSMETPPSVEPTPKGAEGEK